jgi:hypothetical protein
LSKNFYIHSKLDTNVVMVQKDENLAELLRVMGDIILNMEDNQMKLFYDAVTPLMLGNMNAAFYNQIDLLTIKLNQDLVYNVNCGMCSRLMTHQLRR